MDENSENEKNDKNEVTAFDENADRHNFRVAYGDLGYLKMASRALFEYWAEAGVSTVLTTVEIRIVIENCGKIADRYLLPIREQVSKVLATKLGPDDSKIYDLALAIRNMFSEKGE